MGSEMCIRDSLTEVADMPIYRDPFGIPGSPASSTKGALRSDFHRKLVILARRGLKTFSDIDDIINRIESVVFGPPVGRAGEWQWSSAIEVLDANLLFIPIRSLHGVFAYVTSPLLLERFKELLRLMSTYSDKYRDYLTAVSRICNLLGEIKRHEAVTLTKKAFERLVVGNRVLLLETLLLEVRDESEKFKDLLYILRQIDDRVQDRLLVVSDEVMVNIVRRGTWIYTRIALDYEKKVVKTGALWTEEYLPPGSILYTAILYADAKVVIEDVWGSKINEIVKLLKSWGIEKIKIMYHIEDIPIDELGRKKEYRESRIEFRGIKRLFKNAILDKRNEGIIIVGGNETIGRGMFHIKVLTCCLLYTSPSPRDLSTSRMPSSA